MFGNAISEVTFYDPGAAQSLSAPPASGAPFPTGPARSPSHHPSLRGIPVSQEGKAWSTNLRG